MSSFQSPIDRGNHCNSCGFVYTISNIIFQSPIDRGNHCNVIPFGFYRVDARFQSPIDRGNHCNGSVPIQGVIISPFSPLLIGVTIVTAGHVHLVIKLSVLSVPY